LATSTNQLFERERERGATVRNDMRGREGNGKIEKNPKRDRLTYSFFFATLFL
jgi:hypothetical protein